MKSKKIILGVALILSFAQVTSLASNNVAQNNVSVEENTVNNVVNSTEENVVNNSKTENTIKAENSNSNTNNYSNVEVDKYFYNQLDEKSRIIYRAFESNKEQMKTGTYQIELGTSFSDILSQSNGQEKLGEYYQSAIEAYTYDNAEVFYLSPKKMYLNIETTTKDGKSTYNVYINSGEQANYLTDEFNSKNKIDQAIAQIEQVKNQILQNKTT